DAAVLLVGEVLDPVRPGHHAGVEMRDVDPVEMLFGLTERRRHARGARDVAADARTADFPGGLFRLRFVEVVDDDPSALRVQPTCRGEADPRRRARDERALAVQQRSHGWAYVTRTQMAELFGNFQYEIYLAGLSGQKPTFPIAYRDLEAAAKEK